MSEPKSKPWEETWEHVSGAYPFAIFRGNEKIVEAWESNAQADLVAAAPEMASLLLALITCDGIRTTSHIDGADEELVRAVLKKAGVIAS